MNQLDRRLQWSIAQSLPTFAWDKCWNRLTLSKARQAPRSNELRSAESDACGRQIDAADE